jgi:hypothetical protein
MPKVLCIPDSHLKPNMFDLAEKIMEKYEVDYAIQLGDNIDDFYSLEDDYKKHNAKMVYFNYKFPNTVWLYGNHEIHALINKPVTGNIYCSNKYANLYKENFNPKLVHIDNKVIFSHAGIFNNFSSLSEEELNNLDFNKLAIDDSPIWARHNFNKSLKINDKYKNYIQVVGHTPEKEIREDVVDGCKIISIDVFSTNWNKKFGEEKMIIIDTLTGKYQKIDMDFRKSIY